jgi:hypothetical protein
MVEQQEEDEMEEIDDEAAEEATGDDVPEVDTTVPPDPGAGDAEVESIQVLIVKETEETPSADEEPELVPVLAKEPPAAGAPDTKVVPPQATEFICRNCFLVKHRSQLANKKKQLCRDCA